MKRRFSIWWQFLSIVFCCFALHATSYAQTKAADTTLAIAPPQENLDSIIRANVKGLEPIITNILIYDFYTTASLFHYENSLLPEEKKEINFYYNFTINNNFKTKRFSIRTYIFNEYGARHFIDSTTVKVQDNWQFRNTLQVPIKKKVKLQAGVTIKSQLWKTHEYLPDPDNEDDLIKILYADYFSPGYTIYSAGINLTFLKNATLDLGITGGKVTRVKNQRIYEDREQTTLYGVKKGQHKRDDHGFMAQLNIPPRKLNKHFGWEMTGYVFAPKSQIGRLSGYTYDAMNVFHYIFLKNLRISARTQVTYDEQMSHKVFMMNSISVGFYINNKI